MKLSIMVAAVVMSGHVHSSEARGGVDVLDISSTGELEARNACRVGCIPKMCTDKATIGSVTATLTYICPGSSTTVKEKQTVYVTVTEFTTVTPTGVEKAKPTVPPADAPGATPTKLTSIVTSVSKSGIAKTVTTHSKSSSAAVGSFVSDLTTECEEATLTCSASSGLATTSVSNELDEIVHSTTTSTSYVTITIPSISSKTLSDVVESTLLPNPRASGTAGFFSPPGGPFNSSMFLWPSSTGTSYLFDRYGGHIDIQRTGSGFGPVVTSTTYVIANASTASPHKPTLSTSPSASLQGSTGNVRVSLMALFVGLMVTAMLV